MKNYDRHFLALLMANWVFHPFAYGNITEDGVQWTPEVTTTDNDFITVASYLNDWPVKGKVIETEFGLTMRIKSAGSTEAVKFRWQVRTKHQTWLDLTGVITKAADRSAYTEYTFSGRHIYNSYASQIPAELRLQIQRGVADGDNVTAQIKGSSYARVILDPLTPLA